jgi:hypothetical protein
MNRFTIIFSLCFVLSGCAEMSQFIPNAFTETKAQAGTLSDIDDVSTASALTNPPKSIQERYDQRINLASQQCLTSENGCNKGCIGVGAVGIFAALLGNQAGASASQEQMQQCTQRCDQQKNDCDQRVVALAQEKQQALSVNSGGSASGAAGGAIAPSGITGQNAGALVAGGGSAACASTSQESFGMFDREFAAFTARYPNLAGRGGSRDQFQYAQFLGTNGLLILEKYRSCLSAPDYQTYKRALEGTRDQGKTGCEQLSSGAGTCTPTYPANWQ